MKSTPTPSTPFSLFPCVVCLALLLLAPLAHAQDFILPGGPLPPDCTASGSTVTCTDDVEIGEDEVVAVNGPVDWVIEGALDVGERAMVNDGGAAGDLTVQVDGDVELKKDATVVGDIVAGGKIKLKDGSSVDGNITSDDEIKLEKNASVGGNVDATKKVEIKDGSRVDGNITSDDEIKLEENASVGGNVDATKKVEIKDGSRVDGNITSDDEIKLEENASVGGNVDATKKVEIKDGGSVDGNITSGDEVKLKEDASVGGNVVAADKVEIKDGSSVGGNITSGDEVKLEEDASVGGNVDATNKVEIKDGSSVGGTVTSDNGDVEIKEESTVSGDVIALNGTVVIEEGSEVVGCVFSANLNNNGTIGCDKTLPVFDDFESYPAGSIDGRDGGTGWGNAWEGAGGQTIIDTSANPLLFEDSQGRFIRSETTLEISGNNDRVAVRKLDGTFTGDQLFMSMLVRYQGQPGNNDFLGFWTETPGFGDSPQFGVKTNEGGSGGERDFFVRLDTNAAFSTDLEPGETYLLVAEFVKAGAEFFNEGQLWVNPDCTQTPPATPSAQIARNPDSEVSEVSELGLRSVNLGNGQSIEVGQVAAGENWTDVVDCSLPLPDPALELRMEEAAWDGTSGEVTDESGNGNNGTAENDATTSITSPDPALPTDPSAPKSPGTCRYGDFDGDDDFVRVPHDSSLEMSDNDSVTVTAWVRKESAQSGYIAIAQKSDRSYNLQLENGNEPHFSIFAGGFSSPNAGLSLENGTWYHLAGTYDGDEVRIYVDGVLKNSENVSGTMENASGSDVGIATNFDKPGRHFHGQIDEVRIYDSALSQDFVKRVRDATHPCPDSTVVGYDIAFSTNASTCKAEKISITAEDSSGNAVTDYTETVSLSTSTDHGTWSKNASNPDPAKGMLTDSTPDDGAAEYEFDGADDGRIDLDLVNTHADDLKITVTESSGSPSTESTNVLSFRDNAFVIDSRDSLGDDIVAGRDHELRVTLYRRDSNGTCGIPDSYNEPNQPVKLWLDRHSDDPSGASPTATGVTSDTLGNSEPGSTNIRLDFSGSTLGEAGRAPLTLSTSDVGKYALMIAEQNSGFAKDETGSPRSIEGGSTDYVVRPFGLRVVASGNPGASGPGGAYYRAAGTNFDVTVAGVTYDSNDDDGSHGATANDGVPDGHGDANANGEADLVNGNDVTSSFGNEGTDEKVKLKSRLVAPSGGNDVNLNQDGTEPVNYTTFSSGGSETQSQSWPEVGIIELEVGLTNYLGSGRDLTGRSGEVGRFIPARLEATGNNPVFQPFCSMSTAFTYLDQAFGYATDPAVTVTAYNANGGVTKNYGGAFWKLSVPAEFPNRGYTDQSSATATLSADASATSITWADGGSDSFTGSDTATISNERLTYERNGLEGPFPASVDLTIPAGDLTDSDHVCPAASGTCNTNDGDTGADFVFDGDGVSPSRQPIGGSELRYGRLALENAYGSELLPLPIPLRAEYYNGTSFVLNEDDYCTLYQGSHLDISGDISGEITIADEVVTYALVAGIGSFTLNAPIDGSEGSVDLEYKLGVTDANMPWLLFDWKGDASQLNPTAKATFGIFKGNPSLIYTRESVW